MRYIIVGLLLLLAPFSAGAAEEIIRIESLFPTPGGVINTTENANFAVGDPTKKVGVGTDSPQSKLDVEGGVAVGADYSGASAAPSNGMIVQGDVGIGTDDPQETLHVHGWILTETPGANPSVHFHDSTSNQVYTLQIDSENNNFRLYDNSANRARINVDTDGNVGIGTEDPGGNKLEVVGGAIKATDGLIIETRGDDPASPANGQIWLRTDL